MVKSWVCPKCLCDLDNFYIEEGGTVIATERIVCPHCGYTLEGLIGECNHEEIEDKQRPEVSQE